MKWSFRFLAEENQEGLKQNWKLLQMNLYELIVAAWNTHCTENDSKAGPGSAGKSDLWEWREEKMVAPLLGTPHDYDEKQFSI